MSVTDLDYMLFRRSRTGRDLLGLGSSPTTAVAANSTTIATSCAIGFTFTFDGTDYTAIDLSPRGFGRLSGTETSADASRLFASNTGRILAPWWDDTETATTSGYVKFATLGDAPWRYFIAEWFVNLDTSYNATNYARAKFQLVLYESTNRIEFRYGPREVGGSPTNTGTAAIGVKSDTSGTATNYRDLAAPAGVPDIKGTTPIPRLEYLSALAARVRNAALYAYAMTGQPAHMRRGLLNEWRMSWMVPPATKALRPRVARHADHSLRGNPQATSIYGASSGSGADDEILIPAPQSDFRDNYPPNNGPITIVSGALRYDATPAEAGDRLLESPTAGVLTGPVRELCRVRYGVGMTLVALPDDPTAV